MALSKHVRRGLRWLAGIVLSLLVFSCSVIAIIYFQQDRIIGRAVSTLNEDFSGRLALEDSHISPFKQFPYISIDLENLEVFEAKDPESELILHVNDAYIGFDLWSVLNGAYDIRSLDLDSGFFKLVQHTDGSFNIANALSSDENTSAADTSTESFHLDLQSIKLRNIDLIKLNEANDVLVEAYINEAVSSYRTSEENLEVSLATDMVFNLILQGDTSFLHHKHIELQTAFNLNAKTNEIAIEPSELLIEKGQFLMEGTIDLDNDVDLNLNFKGQKPNFDLFLAFVPEEVSPLLERYDNGGRIYFEASVVGPSINGYNPSIEVDFGASEAFVRNLEAGKAVDDLNFRGRFTNGEQRDASTMLLTIEDFSARPETGEFAGAVKVSNFASPDIDMKLVSRFDLDFLAGFLNLNNLQDVSGEVSLELNFHDIIDLSQPEKSIEKLNESYFTRLEVKDLNFRDTDFELPIHDVNILATMDGHEAKIEQLTFGLGNSEVNITAEVSDLPAILHHTDSPVKVKMNIKSDLIDLYELTKATGDSSRVFKERIKDLALQFSFASTARAFTESPNLPIGEFFIDNLHASFANYPHELHDFHADVMIDENQFRIIDFTGMIDQSDFHFNGALHNYDLWFAEQPMGSTQIDFNLTSGKLQFEDLFTYGGENYVPEDYRHEELTNFILHGIADLHFDNKLERTDLKIDRLEAKMKVHPLRFEQFSGNIVLDSGQLQVRDFGGKLGNTSFRSDLSYFFKPDSAHQHHFSLKAPRLDFDQLFAYNPPPAGSTSIDHDKGFNVFQLPFANIRLELDIDLLNYHRYRLADFTMQARMQRDHFVYLDTLDFKAAGGHLAMRGYFNGSDPNNIYFSPDARLTNVDLDQLLFKFENFGQDHLVSDNLHGRLSGEISGKVHLHTDLVPSVEDSELHIDFSVLNGSINNFPPFEAMSDYFIDKNLANIRFDTLRNDLYLNAGVLTIPKMNINSTIGYFELSGEQGVDLQMDYTVGIPVKMITKAVSQKLFKRNATDTSKQMDEIQYRDASKRTSFVNINIKGTADKYNITLGDNKRRE